MNQDHISLYPDLSVTDSPRLRYVVVEIGLLVNAWFFVSTPIAEISARQIKNSFPGGDRV